MKLLDSWKEFAEMVDRHFSFLENEFGYTKTSDSEPRVVYQSMSTRVVIFYEPHGRWDLDIRIEPQQPSAYGNFSLGSWQFECLHRLDWGAVKATIPTHDVNEFESILREEATRLRNHCSTVLKGNFDDVGRLQTLQKEFETRFTMDYQRVNRGKGYPQMVDDLMNQIIKEQNWEKLPN